MGLGGRLWKVKLGYECGALMNEINAFIKRTQESSLLLSFHQKYKMTAASHQN